MLPERAVFGSSTESLDTHQTTARLIDADGWKVLDSCAEVDRTPDYKSVGFLWAIICTAVDKYTNFTM